MTKAILVFSLIFSLTLWAAPSEYFIAVLRSDTLKKVMTAEGASRIESIEKTMTYRCLGCFDFAVVLESSNASTITLTTRLNRDGAIEVHLR
jgi:hypothetical protein